MGWDLLSIRFRDGSENWQNQAQSSVSATSLAGSQEFYEAWQRRHGMRNTWEPQVPEAPSSQTCQ